MLFLHWVGNRFLSLVTNVLYNTTLSDMETCYKLFDRDAARRHHDPGAALRVRARGHRQDPAARHPHLRGADLVHRSRVRRGQEDHLARRLRRALDPRQVPLRRLMTSPGRSELRDGDGDRRRVGRGGRELRVGAAAARLRAVAARRRRARARCPRSSSSTTARPTARSPRCAPRSPTSPWSTPAATSATRPPPTGGSRRRPPRSSPSATPTSSWRPGTAAAMLARLDAEPDLAAVGPALLNPDGSQYPSARAHASTVDAVGHAVLGRLFPRNRFTRRYRQLDARLGPAPRRRLGVGRAAVPPPQRARLGGGMGRALLHVHGGRRPLLAPAPPRVAGRLRARPAA